jgi:PAS domain S-box-containing protein
MVLTALAGSAAYFTTRMGLTGSDEGARNLGWLVFALMAGLSIIMVVLIWKNLSRSLRKIHNQLRQFESEDKIGMIMVDENDELADLVGGINHYLTTIKARFQENRLQHKELQIQAQVAEMERSQTEAVIFSISEAVLVTDKFDELLMANQAAEKLFGFSLKECYRQPIEDYIDSAQLLELIRQTRQQKSCNIIRLMERADKETQRRLSLKVLLSCVLGVQGDVIGVVVVIHDVTAEKEVAQMKDDFVSSVSHEFKTPLASISAYAEMLVDNEAGSDEERRKFCEIIQEQGRRLNRLVDNILNISRIESGLMKAAKEPLDLVRLVEEVIAAMRPQAREKNIGLQLEAEVEAVEVEVQGDRDMIYQALMNLVSNALKYSQTGKNVTIKLSRKGDAYAMIEVRDEGTGIPQECLENIFDKFYRVRANNYLAGGTGLGLHLVKKIVEMEHQGQVSVESKWGQGSTFRIILPLCESMETVGV